MCLRVSFLTRCFYYVKKIQPLIRIFNPFLSPILVVTVFNPFLYTIPVVMVFNPFLYTIPVVPVCRFFFINKN
jgi:hypothetical protein